MEEILNFVYTGKIKICSKDLEKLLRAADYLQLAIISDRCAEMLSSKITTSNVLGIKRFALFHNSRQAVLVADRFIKKVRINISQKFGKEDRV